MSLLTGKLPEVSQVSHTAHAMLIPWGIFSQEIGLVAALENVPISQQTQRHSPQSKLIEFLVAILSGCEHLQDISRSGYPLDQDLAVAQAWGQTGWADYSGVCRTLQACTRETVEAIRDTVKRISQPFFAQEMELALQQDGAIIYDGDLTGRAVSKESTTYEDATFGWMDGEVRFGYQAAMISLRSLTYGRLWVEVTPHPGNMISSQQTIALACSAEERTGVRPWRRLDLLAERLEQQRAELQRLRQREQASQGRLKVIQAKLSQTTSHCLLWTKECATLETAYQQVGREAKKHSHLAKARGKVRMYQNRLTRQVQEVQRLQQTLSKYQKLLTICQQELLTLQERYQRFEADNQANPTAIPMIMRLDAGFASGENLAQLIEMGYEVYTKAINNSLSQALRKRLSRQTDWQFITGQTEMTAQSQLTLSFCPYPLDVALARFHSSDRADRDTIFLHYGQTPVTTDLAGWFHFYNGRQTIEAGIKENKYVLQMNHLKVRSRYGLAIQEEFAALAANLIRWATHWLHEHCPTASQLFELTKTSVKQMVKVAANTSAWVIHHPEGYLLLKFDELSFFAGLQLSFGRGKLTCQLPLPLFQKSAYFALT